MERYSKEHIRVEGLSVECIIGIFDWERLTPQTVKIDLELPADGRRAARGDRIEDTLDYKRVSKSVIAFVRSSRFYLLETLAEKIAELCLGEFGLREIGVSVSKPGALRDTDNVRYSVRRSQEDVEHEPAKKVYLVLGSNIRPDEHIPLALNMLRQLFSVRKISSVYQTSAFGMKGEDFWNAAAEISSTLSEEELKKALLGIEESLGRVRQDDRYVSRPIDIDIVFHDGRLSKSMKEDAGPAFSERGFLLVPLAEIAPHLKDPESGKTLMELLAARAFSEEKTIRRIDTGASS